MLLSHFRLAFFCGEISNSFLRAISNFSIIFFPSFYRYAGIPTSQHIWYALNQINQKINGSNLSYYSQGIGETLCTFLRIKKKRFHKGFSNLFFKNLFLPKSTKLYGFVICVTLISQRPYFHHI